MQYNENYNYGEDSRDLYSNSGKRNSYEDIYSRSRTAPAGRPSDRPPVKRKKKKKRTGKTVLCIVTIVLCCVILALGGAYAYVYRTIDKIEREPLDSTDLGITTENYSSVKNIAFFGIDTREDNDVGRSDAVLILTVDSKNKKFKLTSIARDTYVEIDGHKKDKLTHAYAYGKSQLAVKTLNKNFGLEITDYVAFNFFGLARIIDNIGGVTIDVTEKERVEMNNNIFPEMRDLGVDCPNIETAGTQVLNGGQAVCYARIRHTDSDIQRGNRQKTVLMAMFAKIKSGNPFKLPGIAEMAIKQCKTSLSTKDIMNIGIKAVVTNPKFEQLSIPNDNIESSGKMIGGVWYYVYDLSAAKKEINDFIFEENYYSPDAVASRLAESSSQN